MVVSVFCLNDGFILLTVCGGELAPECAGHILSPFYPNDQYPLNLRCEWNTTVDKRKLLYIAFNTFDVAPDHSVSIIQFVNETEISETSKMMFNGSVVPSDVLLTGPRVNVTFSTEKLHQGGNSGRGFNVSYRTLGETFVTFDQMMIPLKFLIEFRFMPPS